MLFEALFAAGTTVLREFVKCTAVEVIRHSLNIPLILGQINFFLEFDVCFYRSKLEF